MNHHLQRAVASVLSPALLCACLAVSPAIAGAQPPAPPSAKDAGARFGQALGVLEICHGSTLTGKAKSLGEAFTGADQVAFKAEAAKVYQAWNGVKACANQSDPNQCKIIMDKSCAAAEAEIGASGTAVPGLVEFMKR